MHCVYACVFVYEAVCVCWLSCVTERLEVGHKVSRSEYLALTSDWMI